MRWHGWRSDMRNYWREPGFWRWWWQTGVSGQAKGTIAVTVAVAFGIAGYELAVHRPAAQQPATLTTERVVTVVRQTGAFAPQEVATKSPTTTRPADVRMEVISVTPRAPRAARPFELVARVKFAPVPGSIRCSVWIQGDRYRNIRLTWENSIARCFFPVPEDARGQRLQIGLSAVLGGSRARTTLGLRVS